MRNAIILGLLVLMLGGVLMTQTTRNGTAYFKTYTDILTIAAPANPASGDIRLYADSGTGNLSCLTSAGASCMPSSGISAAFAFLAGNNGFRSEGNGSTDYIGFNGFATETGTEKYRVTVLGKAVTAGPGFYVYIDSTVAANCTFTATLRKCTGADGISTCADTAVTIAIPAASTAGIYKDVTHSVAVAAGNGIDVSINEGGGSCAAGGPQLAGFSVVLTTP